MFTYPQDNDQLLEAHKYLEVLTEAVDEAKSLNNDTISKAEIEWAVLQALTDTMIHLGVNEVNAFYNTLNDLKKKYPLPSMYFNEKNIKVMLQIINHADENKDEDETNFYTPILFSDMLSEFKWNLINHLLCYQKLQLEGTGKSVFQFLYNTVASQLMTYNGLTSKMSLPNSFSAADVDKIVLLILLLTHLKPNYKSVVSILILISTSGADDDRNR